MHRSDSNPGRRHLRRAFTLLEVIVVVTIIALLATLVAPRLLKNIGRSKISVAKAEVASLAQQVSLWMADNGHGRRPPDDFDLEALAEGDDPYLRVKDLLDPWENPYIIVNPGEENPDFDIVSHGADGQPGGDGDDADIVN